MEKFLKNVQLEKETLAIINFFKLLKQLEVAELDSLDSKYCPTDTFCLIGGLDSINRLIVDVELGNISIHDNSIGNLFYKLENNISMMNNITFGKNKNTIDATNQFELIKKFYNEIYSVNGNINTPAIDDIITLPLPKEIIDKFIKRNVKTIGGR